MQQDSGTHLLLVLLQLISLQLEAVSVSVGVTPHACHIVTLTLGWLHLAW